MTVQKCDCCKKVMDRKQSLRIAVDWQSRELCQKCGKPVIDFMLKKKLITEEEIKRLTGK